MAGEGRAREFPYARKSCGCDRQESAKTCHRAASFQRQVDAVSGHRISVWRWSTFEIQLLPKRGGTTTAIKYLPDIRVFFVLAMKQGASGNNRLNPAALLFVVHTCSGPPGVPIEEVREFGCNRSNLRELKPARIKAAGRGAKDAGSSRRTAARSILRSIGVFCFCSMSRDAATIRPGASSGSPRGHRPGCRRRIADPSDDRSHAA
jgi:hypothetical protein